MADTSRYSSNHEGEKILPTQSTDRGSELEPHITTWISECKLTQLEIVLSLSFLLILGDLSAQKQIQS